MNLYKMVFVMLFAFMVMAFGQDYNNTTLTQVGPNYVLYYGNTGTMTDSTGDYYSRAFNIGIHDRTQPIYIKARTTNITGTEDVNLSPYLTDGPTPDISDALVSTVLLDQLTAATMQRDTLTTDNYWRAHEYAFLLFDGQAGNPQTTTYFWILVPCKADVLTEWVRSGIPLVVDTQP